MRGNQFGQVFCLTTFGESHGPAMGAVIDGCPAGVNWRQDLLTRFLERRRPGQQAIASARQEPDEAQILSGIYQGKTLGTPLAAVIFNRDARAADYSAESMKMRQGHATDLWHDKYGVSDPRGSGRASGRETVSRVLGGSVARMLVEQMCPEIKLVTFTANIGEIGLQADEITSARTALAADPWSVDQYSSRCPSLEKNSQIEKMLVLAKEQGESYGGSVVVSVSGLPRGLGQPVFGKLKSSLASAYLGIGATVGLEFGEGTNAAFRSGSDFHSIDQDYAGMRGGISTGDPLWVRLSFKPASSRGSFAVSGRHDPCIVPRAVPVVEAMTWLVLADQILLARLDKI